MVSIQGVNKRETYPAFQATADTLYPLPSIYVFHTPAGWHALNVCDDEPEKRWNIRLTIKIDPLQVLPKHNTPGCENGETDSEFEFVVL